MKKTTNQQYYEERLGRVTAYIHEHLDDKLDLNKLAEIACLSAHHWHRIYHAVLGETLAATVKRMRLHRAAELLAHSDLPITQIARKAAYDNVQSFTRIFRASYGMPPSQYRKLGGHIQYQTSHKENIMFNVEIKKISSFTAVTLNHTGSYLGIGKTFETLFGLLVMRDLLNKTVGMIGVYYDDPNITPEKDLRSKAGAILSADVTFELPLQLVKIAGGVYAVLRHKGPYSDLGVAYQWLYSEWLLKSGRQVADAPVFEKYINSPTNTAPSDLITDIHLPLA